MFTGTGHTGLQRARGARRSCSATKSRLRGIFASYFAGIRALRQREAYVNALAMPPTRPRTLAYPRAAVIKEPSRNFQLRSRARREKQTDRQREREREREREKEYSRADTDAIYGISFGPVHPRIHLTRLLRHLERSTASSLVIFQPQPGRARVSRR